MKNKLLKYIKHAFGAVEVILLITVVAVLATFTVITIDQAKKKPVTYTETETVYVKDNADYLTINAINSQLKNKSSQTVHETIKYLETKGYAIDKLTPQDKSFEFVYLQKENVFGILENKKVIYPEANATNEITPNIWRFTSKSPNSVSDQYSYYLLDNCEGSVNVGGGVDVGNNEDITTINHTNTKYKGTVLIRTDSLATSLNIRSTLGSIMHFGTAGEANIEKVSFSGFYEYGKISSLKITSGKIVVKNGGFIDFTYVLRPNVGLVQDGGFIEEACCVSIYEDESNPYGYNNVNVDNGGNVYIEYINSSTLTNYTKDELIEKGDSKVESSLSKLSFEGVIARKEGLKQLFTLENFAKKTNSGSSFKDATVELLGDVDLKSVSNWTPINGFKGVFDGKGHTIRNLNITSSAPNTALGLFGKVSDGAVVKNVSLSCFNISSSGENTNVGGLVGQVDENAIIENVSIDEGSTISGGNVGGVVGACSYSIEEGIVSITNCSVSAKLIGNMVGGFISRILNLEYGYEIQKSTTIIKDSIFNGQILASAGKNNWAAGLIAYVSGGDYNSKVMVSNTNVVSNGNIKSASGNITCAIFGSTTRYHLNNLTVNDEEIISPLALSGIQVSDTLVVAINQKLFSVTFGSSEALKNLPESLSDEKAILASEDMKFLGINGEFHENEENLGAFTTDVWYEIINVNLTEEEDFEFALGDEYQYVGIDPSKMFEGVEGKIQRKRYIAGHDELEDKDIFKFDFFRFVEPSTTEEDGWMDKLQLTEGWYYDDPTEFVDQDKYEITSFYLEDRENPENSQDEQLRHKIHIPDDENEEEHNMEEPSSEQEEIIEKTKIYVVTLK